QSAFVSLGTTKFGSFGGGPFDAVNLGNLNVHFSIPVRHKAGRGMPFTYDVVYDSSVWTWANVNGTSTWLPMPAYGWKGVWGGISQGLAEYPQAGLVSVGSTSGGSAPCSPPSDMHMVSYTTYSSWTYRDYAGIVHPFSVQTSTGSQGCSNLQWLPPTAATGVA